MDMSAAPGITIERVGLSEASFAEVFEMLLELYDVVGVVPLDRERYARGCHDVLKQGMTFIARDELGRAVGTLGLMDAGWWYAAEEYRFLQDKWFYVRPEHRGHAGVKLLRAARDLGIEKERIVYVWNTNPDRRQKGLPFGIEAQRLGYIPFGFMLRLNARRVANATSIGTASSPS